MRLVYVAGPYTSNDPWVAEQHARRAEELGYEVMKLGGCWPIIPHSNTRHLFVQACTYEQALAGTLEMLRRCDAAIFVPGWEHSNGARSERAWCSQMKLPTFDTIAELAAWLAVPLAVGA